MRLAYHPTGATLDRVLLDAWLVSAIAAIAAPPSPGVALTLADPRRPYAWGTEIVADERTTLAGQPIARVRGTIRRGTLDFNRCGAADLASWEAWHAATMGGRIPFALELPLTREVVAVTARVERLAELAGPARWQPAQLAVVEYAL